MVNIRNLIDDVKCFQTVRDLRQSGRNCVKSGEG